VYRQVMNSSFLNLIEEMTGNESFYIVIFSYSLHHQDCAKALAEAKRVLRRGGHILIIESTPDGGFTLFVSIFKKKEIPHNHSMNKFMTAKDDCAIEKIERGKSW
jgi:ubiquinone/menaquinone biosynthesis C-methylase UbiE